MITKQTTIISHYVLPEVRHVTCLMPSSIRKLPLIKADDTRHHTSMTRKHPIGRILFRQQGLRKLNGGSLPFLRCSLLLCRHLFLTIAAVLMTNRTTMDDGWMDNETL